MKQNSLATKESNLNSLIEMYMSVSTIRPEILFRYFLPIGYRYTTLSSIDSYSLGRVIFAKIHLGMIITLYDDLADHPEHRNPELLSELYNLNIEKDRPVPFYMRGQQRKIFELARVLFIQLTEILQDFPYYENLKAVLVFDIEQFYSCNRYSELMSSLPDIRNLVESQSLGPHNMGIVAAGTIDLMSSPSFQFSELGVCREVFLLGQRLGRISNLIFTYKREKMEGDLTNEIVIAKEDRGFDDYQTILLREFGEKQSLIRSYNLRSFQTYLFAAGLLDLHNLHSSLEGKI
ncbi:MAG: hypothetical protein JNL11_03040 [Bdellovibrionaceae bacterium]|nr:hypothetical protein [Pseudobdellovibrionaceae bacterium]